MGYKERVEKARRERTFSLIAGVHKTKMLQWEFKKSNNGNEMFVLEFKPTAGPEDAPEGYMEKVKEKKRFIKMNFMPMNDFQFDTLLEFIEAFGFDLNSFDENDTEFKDIKNALNVIEEVTPSVDIKLVEKIPAQAQYRFNYYFTKQLKDVTKVVNAETTTDAPESPAAPKEEAPEVPTKPEAPESPEAPAAPTPPPSAPVEKKTKDGHTLAALVENGWSEEQAFEHYPELR